MEMNTDRTSDKSLFGTIVQSSFQRKAPTGKKLRKKQNPPSSEPKTSTYVRRAKPKKTVAETQYAEDSKATVGIPKTDKTVEMPLDDNLDKNEMVNDYKLKSLGTIYLDQTMKDVSSDPESMLDDEIMSISGDDEEA
uniref:Uncharacterized protein n=1 Tax=Tanacetum cinerariifolium TaxID=118510 RepID=A0A6L2PA68_TANCI|nr:hypothetical protein [Tanacetum cinerariifolium]